eukprot:TRINITY_DN24727_c0_g1_i1.p1 TRINITY_DN24727_c0_g1~~TRINITY_DN24727_c0_g1_i1.p1  ORF type:complete len:264 (+),score=87.82 TRINITY_DN24727_c0_g1_i1:80-793(+)
MSLRMLAAAACRRASGPLRRRVFTLGYSSRGAARPALATPVRFAAAPAAGADDVLAQAEAALGESDPFKLLGLPRDFAVDPRQLQARLRAKQMLFHPDRAVGRPQHEQELLQRASAHCNEAHDVLADDYTRMARLLFLGCGKDLQKEDDKGHQQLAQRVDSEFLGQLMEIHEELAEDPAVERLRELDAANTEAFEECTKAGAAALRAEDWDAAEQQLCRLSYFRNIRNLIRARLPAS